VVFAPVNLLLAAAGLAWFGIARCFDQDEETEGMRLPRICLMISTPLWFFGWADPNLEGPFTGMISSMAVAGPLVISMAATMAAGFFAVVDPAVRSRTRRIGLWLFGVGAVAMAVWASAGASGSLGAPGQWLGAVLRELASLPAQMPRSGAFALLAFGLVAAADYTLRGGLIRHYAKK
jgi:hypothetical protein